jgi:hypothetical protein
VFFLRQKAGQQMPGGAMRSGAAGNEHRNDFPTREPFPPENLAGAPIYVPPRNAQRGEFPPNGFPPRGMMGGAMGEPMIPRNAEVVHEGKCFTLAIAPTPPAFLTAGRRPPN